MILTNPLYLPNGYGSLCYDAAHHIDRLHLQQSPVNSYTCPSKKIDLELFVLDSSYEKSAKESIEPERTKLSKFTRMSFKNAGRMKGGNDASVKHLRNRKLIKMQLSHEYQG